MSQTLECSNAQLIASILGALCCLPSFGGARAAGQGGPGQSAVFDVAQAGGSAPLSVTRTTDLGREAALSLLDFGADDTGQEDSSPAFARLMQAVGGRRQVHIIIPAGIYRLAKRVLLETAGNAENYGMRVQGAGEDVTELRVDNPEGGIEFRGVHINRLSFTISDLSLVAVREQAGVALAFDTANPGDHHARQFNAENLLIRGDRFDRGSFSGGIEVRNAWYPRLDNVKITSAYGPRAAEPDPMRCAILLEDCYSPLLRGCYVWGALTGLRHRAKNIQPEDGIVRDSYFVGNVEGIVVDLVEQTEQWPEPGFHISDCHVAYRDRGIVLKGVRQASINHALFYCGDRTGTRWFSGGSKAIAGGDEKTRRPYEPRDIDLEHATDIVINANIFTEPANPNRVGIRIGPASGHILISGNQFNMGGIAIKNESAEPSYSSGNIFSGKPSWAGQLVPCQDKPGTMRRTDFDRSLRP